MVLPADGVYAAPEQNGPVLNETAGMTRTRYQLQVNIAVSGVFEGIEQLQVAYRQTRQLLRLAGLGKTVLFAGDAEENREQSPLEFTDSPDSRPRICGSRKIKYN
jgi:hypothetical protein